MNISKKLTTKLGSDSFWKISLTFFFGLAIGVLVVLYCERYLSFHFTISDEVVVQMDPLNFVSLLFSLVLTIYVVRKLNNTDESQRAARDLFIDQLVDLDKGVSKAVRGFVGPKGAALDRVSLTFKQHRMRAGKLTSFAVEQSYLPINCREVKTLQSLLKKILELLTTTPKDDTVEDGVRFKDGKLFYSSLHEEKIFRTLNSLNMEVLKLAALVRSI